MSELMKFKFKVDQAGAVRLGFATEREAVIEIDLGELTFDERAVFARTFVGEKYGMVSTYAIVEQLLVDEVEHLRDQFNGDLRDFGPFERQLSDRGLVLAALVEPCLSGVQSVLFLLRLTLKELTAYREARRMKRQEAADEAIRSFLDARDMNALERRTCRVTREVHLRTRFRTIEREIELIGWHPSQFPSRPADASPELREALEAFTRDLDEEKLRLENEALAELIEEEAQIVAEDAEKQAAISAARSAMLRQDLPAETFARIEAGYTDDNEIVRFLRNILRKRAGFLPYEGGHRNSMSVTRVSDEAFAELVELKASHVAALGEDASIEVRKAWTYIDCPVGGCRDCDEDGEHETPAWYMARVVWTDELVDVEVRAHVMLGPVPA